MVVRTGRPTLEDVAALAGVAPVTVSRVINSSDLVTPKTRTKVMQAVEELGYVPNRLAGGLASAKSRTLALIVPASYLSTFNFLRGIISTASEAGYQVSVGLAGQTMDETGRAVMEALTRCPEGIILLGGFLSEAVKQQIAASRIPVVEAWDIPSSPIDMAVGYSLSALAGKIARFILDKGYERPFMAWAPSGRAATLRLGISQALIESGRDEPAHINYDFPGNFPDGIDAIGRIAEMDPRPDLLLTMSDWLAHGAIYEAGRRGWSVPGDLAITGFGNQTFAEYLTPSLTSVDINGERVGTLAVKLLLQRLRGEPVDETIIDVGAELVLRQSA